MVRSLGALRETSGLIIVDYRFSTAGENVKVHYSVLLWTKYAVNSLSDSEKIPLTQTLGSVER